MSDWPRYLSVMLREESRLARQIGDTEGSRTAAARYHEYRDSAAVVSEARPAGAP